jgi:hypothetical protein
MLVALVPNLVSRSLYPGLAANEDLGATAPEIANQHLSIFTLPCDCCSYKCCGVLTQIMASFYAAGGNDEIAAGWIRCGLDPAASKAYGYYEAS